MGQNLELHAGSEEEMLALGRTVGSLLYGGAVVGLKGPLGAGKTTLARGIAEGMGLDDNYVVSSPTYTIMQNYPCAGIQMCHLDLYRIEGEEDLDSTGYRDSVSEKSVLVVEWPEKVPAILPRQHLLVEIRYLPRGRSVTLIPAGDRYRSLALNALDMAGG